MVELQHEVYCNAPRSLPPMFSRSERTVARYLRRKNEDGDAGQRWRVFLNNHREVIAVMDFFTVMTQLAWSS